MLGKSKSNPVVGPISLESTVAYAQQLRGNMIDWTSGKEWNPRAAADWSHGDRLLAWQKQFASARGIIRAIERSGAWAKDKRDDGTYKGFVYLFNSAPIGIMLTTDAKDSIRIDDLVASPAASGAGIALIEVAVRWSERCGFLGKVSLNALDRDVSQIYMRYGFQMSGPFKLPSEGWMHLEPLTSDVWEKSDEGWTLKSKIGKAYAVSGLTP